METDSTELKMSHEPTEESLNDILDGAISSLGFKENTDLLERRNQLRELLLATPEPKASSEDGEIEYPPGVVTLMGEYQDRAQNMLSAQIRPNQSDQMERGQIGFSLACARIYWEGKWWGMFEHTIKGSQGDPFGHHQPKYDPMFAKINEAVKKEGVIG